jgi:hypothetical protein
VPARHTRGEKPAPTLCTHYVTGRERWGTRRN